MKVDRVRRWSEYGMFHANIQYTPEYEIHIRTGQLNIILYRIRARNVNCMQMGQVVDVFKQK